MPTLEINILAVLAATVAHQIIGTVWYGVLFGKLWMRARGVRQEDLGAGAAQAIVVSTVAALVMALALAVLLTVPERVDLATGLTIGAIAGVGFVATTTVINGVYENRSWTLIVLYAAYEIVALAVMGAILGAWR